MCLSDYVLRELERVAQRDWSVPRVRIRELFDEARAEA